MCPVPGRWGSSPRFGWENTWGTVNVQHHLTPNRGKVFMGDEFVKENLPGTRFGLFATSGWTVSKFMICPSHTH